MKPFLFLLVLLLTACGTTKVGIVSAPPQKPEVVYVYITTTPAPTVQPTEKPFRYTAHYVNVPGGGYVADVEDGVIVGNGLPDWMEVCTETNVYGNPYGMNEPFATLKPGDVVRIHDLSHDNTWVMVETARWIPISALCWNK